jgi:dihydrofolate reductase
MEHEMRKLIAGMKISADEKVNTDDGDADWVEGWSDDYGMMSQVDACVLGGTMYSGYEPYWTRIQDEPDKPHPETGKVPTPGEVEWARFAKHTPHYVLSRSINSARWPQTRVIRGPEDVAALKRQTGTDIYLMGGAATVASLIDAGLVNELRLIIYPLIAGEGTALFATTKCRRELALRTFERLPDGRVSLIYGIS